MYRRRRSAEPGRYRLRLAERLQALGIEIEAEDIDPAKGRWRNRTAAGDGTRWWARGKAAGIDDLPLGYKVLINGYDTVKLCAARGVTLDLSFRGLAGMYDAHACE